MTFTVIDRKTGKEPTRRVIDTIAKKGGLMDMDIDQFFVGEDGRLVLADDCGNVAYCDTERFEVIAEQEPKTGWIPVSERLPEKYTYTLWCASSGYIRSDYFNGEYWEDAKKFCYDVIAWMPLPEPYKESEVQDADSD